MKLDGRRESTNVEDRRGAGGKAAGLGIGGIAIVAIITLLMGGNLGDVFQSVVESGGLSSQTVTNYEPTAENEALAKFSRQILASTEDVWGQYFLDNNLGTYKAPTLVLYTGSTSTACGQGQSAMGPFYCSADEKLYIDLSFFSSMPDFMIMARASAPISCLMAGGMSTSVSGFSPRSPTSPAVVVCAFLEGATTPNLSSLFFPANARSRTSISSNSDS